MTQTQVSNLHQKDHKLKIYQNQTSLINDDLQMFIYNVQRQKTELQLNISPFKLNN